jgi:hypothetical protein
LTDQAWLDEVPARRFVEPALMTVFPLAPGDRSRVEPGADVTAGDPLFEHVRDARVDEVYVPAEAGAAGVAATDAAGLPADPTAASAVDPIARLDAIAPPGPGGNAPDGPLAEGWSLLAPDPDPRPAKPPPAPAGPVAGGRWSPAATSRRRGRTGAEGELLAPLAGQRDRWRIATGEHHDVVASPLTGRVASVTPGSALRVVASGLALRGVFAAGTATRGRLELATDASGELRPGGIDVGRAGSVLVVGSRIDAEALTRARAMGVRGIVVAALPGKDLRDFLASERRQRAALHPAPPFGVLVLEGAIRRRLPGLVVELFERLAGRDVTLLVDPPALVFDPGDVELPELRPDRVRIRSGAAAGTEGRVLALSGPRRFPGNVTLEAARVAIDGEAVIDVPLGDLERFV